MTRSDTSRAEAFSDAVIAIVITLLVLELTPPETEPGGLLAGLLGQWPTYLAYAASYTYLAVIWLNHKSAFSRIRQMDIGLQWANLGILATLALLPWPTAVIIDTAKAGNLADERVAVALYAIVGALLCLSWLIFFSHLARHPELTEEEVEDTYFARERPRALAGVVLSRGGNGWCPRPSAGGVGDFRDPARLLRLDQPRVGAQAGLPARYLRLFRVCISRGGWAVWCH